MNVTRLQGLILFLAVMVGILVLGSNTFKHAGHEFYFSHPSSTRKLQVSAVERTGETCHKNSRAEHSLPQSTRNYLAPAKIEQPAVDKNTGEEVPFIFSGNDAGCNQQIRHDSRYRDPVGNSSEVSMLQDVLESAPTDELRILAAYALAEIGDSTACSILIARASCADRVGDLCLDALGRVRSVYGQETLIQAAQDSALSLYIRVAVIVALSRHNSARVETVLINLNAAESDSSIQNEIRLAIAMLQEKKPLLISQNTQRPLNNLQDEVWY